MNAIRNYLDNMFRNLPNTEAVRRAKSELLQMMEDKYEELIAEGKTENEAVGIVISEFGNLDELADSLGISEAVTENPVEDKPMLSMDRVKEYLSMNNTRAILTPLGIALCILSVVSPILAEILPDALDVIGAGGMFGIIAIAVGLFIFSGIKNKEYAEVRNKECSLSIEGAEYVRNERRGFKNSYGLMSSFGIGLCILSFLNPILLDRIPFIDSNVGAAMMFVFVALGVFLITSANTRMNGYDRLLALNESGKMSEEFVPKSDRKVNKAPIIICSIIAIAVVVISAGVRFFIPLFTGVFIKDDIIDTVATTYELTDGENAVINAQGEIKAINLPDALTAIGESAFESCSALTTVIVPDQVQLVRTQTFYRCAALNKLTLGKSVTYIDLKAFADCKQIASVTCRGEVPPEMANPDCFVRSIYRSATLYVPIQALSVYGSTGVWPWFTSMVGIDVDAVHGDVNGDGEVNIADVNVVIDAILADVRLKSVK